MRPVYYKKKDGSKGKTTDEDIANGNVVACAATPAGTLMTVIVETKSNIILKIEVDVLNNVVQEV